MEPCAEWQAESPENAAHAWCRRYRIHLDADGRFCRRCHADPAFREGLEGFARRRAAKDCEGGVAWCERFRVAAGPEVCGKCQTEPEYRAFLAGQRDVRPLPRRVRPDRCPHRGEAVRTEWRRCCGGRLKEVAIHACARRGTAAPEHCAECDGE